MEKFQNLKMVKLSEYTIIAEGDKIQEISPDVFYNVWTLERLLILGVHPYHCHVMPLEEAYCTWIVWRLHR